MDEHDENYKNKKRLKITVITQVTLMKIKLNIMKIGNIFQISQAEY